MHIDGLPDSIITAINWSRLLVFMVYIQQQISSFNTGLLVRMVQKTFFPHLWASSNLPLLPSHQSTHLPTPDLSGWLSYILFLTARPKLQLITRAPHHQLFWPKIHLNHPAKVHWKFPGKLHLTTRVCIYSPAPENFINITQQRTYSIYTSTEPPSLQPTYPPSVTPTHKISTHPTLTPSCKWSIPVHLDGHKGHTVPAIKDGSHLQVQSWIKSCIQSCEGYKTKFLPCHLI